MPPWFGYALMSKAGPRITTLRLVIVQTSAVAQKGNADRTIVSERRLASSKLVRMKVAKPLFSDLFTIYFAGGRIVYARS